MKLRPVLKHLSLPLAIFAAAQAGADDCMISGSHAGLSSHHAAPSPPAPSFAAWNVDHLPTLKAEDFFPPEYLESIRREKGPIQFRMVDLTKTHKQDHSYESASFEVSTNNHPLILWSLIFDRKHPDKVEISGLKLENPIAENRSSHLRLSQERKDLPAPVFGYARDKLMELLRAGGFKTVVAVPETYGMALLYRRFVRLSPTNKLAEGHFQHIDKLFQYARASLPADVRVRSADDFSRILGAANDKTSEDSTKLETLWLSKKGKKLPAGIAVFRDRDGTVLGLIDRRKKDSKPTVYFFDPSAPQKHFLRWSTLAENHEIGLELGL